jgi:hypothetical protein
MLWVMQQVRLLSNNNNSITSLGRSAEWQLPLTLWMAQVLA